MDYVNIELIQNKNKLERSELTSSLLFGHKKIANSRDSIMRKAIFSVVLFLHPEERTLENIRKVYNQMLCNDTTVIEEQQFMVHMSKLEAEKFVKIKGDNVIVETDEDAMRFVETVNEKTQQFVSRIIAKTGVNYGKSIDENLKGRLAENIKKAFSVLFKLSGLEYVGARVKSSDESLQEDANEAVSVAMDRLNDGKLSHALVVALADAVRSINPDDVFVLELWAKVYVSTQVMNIDPSLCQFKLKQLKGKEFVLDTDFVLNCLTQNARYSEMSRLVLHTLLSGDCQCKLYVPKAVVDEVMNHARAALSTYGKYQESLLTFTDDILETQLANVFIEDYVKTKRSNISYADLSFNAYLANIVDFKRSSFLERKILNLSNKIQVGYDTDVALKDQTLYDKLYASVLDETAKSAKGMLREDSINSKIAETDVKLYLSVYNKNIGLEDKDLLSKKTYLLTRSIRSQKCARALGLENADVLCRPEILAAVFMEMGKYSTAKFQVVNLFSNPFLVYTTHRIWEDVSKLIAAGIDLKYADIDRLRYEYEDSVDSVITATTHTDFSTAVRIWSQKGYDWAKNVDSLFEKIQALQTTLSDTKAKLKATEAENREIKKKSAISVIDYKKMRKKQKR